MKLTRFLTLAVFCFIIGVVIDWLFSFIFPEELDFRKSLIVAICIAGAGELLIYLNKDKDGET